MNMDNGPLPYTTIPVCVFHWLLTHYVLTLIDPVIQRQKDQQHTCRQ